MTTPNPGSDEAIKQGCKCPAEDNGHGKGYMEQEGIFWITEDCPIHGTPPLITFLAEHCKPDDDE